MTPVMDKVCSIDELARVVEDAKRLGKRVVHAHGVFDLIHPGHIRHLEAARRFGADTTINNGREDPIAAIMELTGGLGADAALEAVGVPQTFELAASLVRPGGRIANIGVHGKPVTLHLETLWTRDVTITTGLVDTFSIPQLMRLVASERLDPSLFATHRFPMSDTMAAYDAFADAANTGALKVVLYGPESTSPHKEQLATAVAS